ncbi:hypothetical protein GN956_G1797 [Arapaima gigas]
MGVYSLCFALLCSPCLGQSVQNLMELNVPKLLTVSCNQRMELHCKIISNQKLTVNYMSWLDPAGRAICEVDDTTPTDGPLCTYTKGKELVLHLPNITPATQGSYTCKIRSDRGSKHNMSDVKLQECYAEGSWSSTDTEVTCCFPGVYPEGTIHWFSGDSNVTEDAVMMPSHPDSQGLFNVSSTLLSAQPEASYTCKLWLPTGGSTLVEIERVRKWPFRKFLSSKNGAEGLEQQLLWALLLASFMMD